MAKITQGLSLTFRIGSKDMNQFSKINYEVLDFEVPEIDSNLSIEEQLKIIKETGKKLWAHVFETVDKQVDDIKNG